MQQKLLLWSVTAALAGFLFGFDTVVISGADKTLQALWQSSDVFHGTVVMGMALWGTVIGALFGAWPTNKLGRKKTLIWIGVFYLVSALGSALANDPYTFAFFRFLGGLGVGASTIAAPAFVSEIAPPDRRGRLVALYQFNIVLGILFAFVSNYLLSAGGDSAWRWMLGVESLPALAYLMLIFLVPESPRWLILQGRAEEARKTLASLYEGKTAEEMIIEIRNSQQDAPHRLSGIFQRKYRFVVLLAFLMAFFNQFSGINAFLYYAPRIFEAAGLGASTAFLSSIGIGVINLVFTLLGMSLIDKLGRKQLMYVGSFGYIISLSVVALAFYYKWSGMVVPFALFAFIASHAIGQGSVIWVFLAEIFPDQLRSAGQSLGSTTHWILAALIPSFIPALFSGVGPAAVFAFFAGMMVLQLFFVHYLMPETKGQSLEEVSGRLS